MRAVTQTSPGPADVLSWSEDQPRPEAGPDDVLIRVVASGVNRADLLQREGRYPPPAGASDILGLEVSGHVAAVGRQVTGWSVGDPCVALLSGGGYAEYAAAPAGQVLPAPTGLDLVSAAGLIEAAATVASNFSHAQLRSGETLLVHGGAGGIGTFAISYARARGVRVIATAGSPAKLELCRERGAEVALDYHGDWLAGVRQATGGRGVDVILDVMGASYLDSNLRALAVAGRLVVIGLQGGRSGTLDLAALLAKRATVTATSLRGRSVEEKAAICADVRRQIWPLISDGTLPPAPETRFAAADAAEAHRLLESGRNTGKILLVWDK